MNCPYCGGDADCETVDVGVGNIQCTPYICENCWSEEISPYANLKDSKISAGEKYFGWYLHPDFPDQEIPDKKMKETKELRKRERERRNRRIQYENRNRLERIE